MYTCSVLVLCLAAAAYGFPESQIVGGHDAPPGKYPYQVSLRQDSSHFCGGSIIDNRHILTAAHCVALETDIKSITVHVGTNLLSEEGQTYEVERIAVHSKFGYLLANDIALIRVTKDIVFDDKVKPIALPTGNKSYDGEPCVLSGWGTTTLGGNTPDKLQYLNTFVENQAKCKKSHVDLHESNICSFSKYGEGGCHGDSGGPLVSNGVQIGIVSYGEPCAVGKPDVFTRVSSFTSWIEEQKKLFKAEGEVEAKMIAMSEA